MITTFNLFTVISWIVTGVISAILSSLFLLKNPGKRLNQLFAVGFLLWSFSMIFNGTIFSIAYHSLAIANALRDIAVVCGIFSGFSLFVAAIGIYFGPESLNWKIYLPTISISTILSVFGALNDWVTTDGLGGYKTTDNLAGKVCVQIISLLFVLVANVLLLLTYRASENSNAKRRIGFFVIGYSTVLMGVFLFILDGIFDLFLEISPFFFPSLALITWVTGPILMLIGFHSKSSQENKSFISKQLESKEQFKHFEVGSTVIEK